MNKPTNEPDSFQASNPKGDSLETPSKSVSFSDASEFPLVDSDPAETSSSSESQGDKLTPLATDQVAAEPLSAIEQPSAAASPAATDSASSTRKKMSTKVKIAIACVVAAVVVIGIAAGVILHQRAEEEAHNNYVSTMRQASYSMLNGAASAEDLGNTVSSVWNNAIWNGRDASKWDADEKAYFSNDFNESLRLLFADSATSKKVGDIASNQASVKNLMSSLNNPPSDLTSAYSTLTEMYDEYLTLTNLATSPSGSYQTFTTKFREADNDFLTYYNRLETQLP